MGFYTKKLTILATKLFAIFLIVVFSLSPAYAVIDITDDITTNTTWSPGDVYVVWNNINVDLGDQLTIQPGTIIKFKSAAGITVNGELSSNATVSSKSYFTSFTDDSVGGNTDGGGASTGTAGYWSY